LLQWTGSDNAAKLCSDVGFADVDFRIHNAGDAGQSFTIFPSDYTDTLGRGNATFTGAQYFTPEDYEVWAVNS
jgi:hypothetical protein